MITPLKKQIDDGYGSAPITVAHLDAIASWLADAIKPQETTDPLRQEWATKMELARIYGISENEISRFVYQARNANKLPTLEPRSSDGITTKRTRYHIASFRRFMEHENNLASKTIKNL